MDMGLRVHRILQYIATVGTTVVAGVILTSMDTWGKLKDNAVRMENVPADIRAIRSDMEQVKTGHQDHEYRLRTLEHETPTNQ